MTWPSPHLGMSVGGKEKLFLPAKKPDSKASNMSGSSALPQRKRLWLFDPQGLHKGNILPHPLPHDPIPPFRVGWEKWLQGEGEAPFRDPGNWGLIPPGIASQHIRPNPRAEFPARTSTPSHKHKHDRGVPAEPPGGSAIPAFSLDSDWE